MTTDDEIDLDVATAQLEDAERALDGLRDRAYDSAMDDDCEEIGDALNSMGVVLAELRRRRIQVNALVAGLRGWIDGEPMSQAEVGDRFDTFMGKRQEDA